MSEAEVIEVMRRVLSLVDGYLAKMPQEALHTDGAGLMTIAEFRQHVAGALALRAAPPAGRKG
jgi:hypothetical protein